MAMSIPEEKLGMALQEQTLRVGAGSGNMERGPEFSCGEWGILQTLKDPTTLKGPAVCIKSGRSWGGQFC